ncbi:hypothetical protein PUN28_004081 [Cardiocondyla obscurior]|uniref:Scavenger receptor class B member 1 n=1 Tax=Cardiocondyla obscurior TaxID=286306 RepID=A0AAW2GLN2_9HYME
MTISMTDLNMEKKTIWGSRRFRFWIAWIYIGVFLVSSAVFYVFWYTDMFNNYVTSQMELRNGTNTFDLWQRPVTRMKYKIYIFNYTNVDEFEAGTASKLRVQELGPYVYRETLTRNNVVLYDNGTVSFQSERSYKWISGRPGNDTIIVPNVPLMFTTAYVRDLNFGMRFVINTVLSTLKEKPFITVPADGFLWGYDTELFEMAKPFIMFQRKIPDKFGLMAMKNGVDEDRITMHTGTQGKETLGMIDRLNGMNNRNVWDDERCDKIEGAESNIFSPISIEDTSRPLYVYFKDFCRKIPFHFTEQVTTYDIPALRYKLKPDVYNFSYKQNECFCPMVHGTRVCPPTGFLNMSVCSYNSPLLSSFPHFYGADKSMLEQIDGLNPRKKDHESYADIHPRLAIAIAGWTRLQVNLEVRKAVGVPFLGRLKDGTILPLIWMDIGTDELPEQILNIIHRAYFTAGNVEMAFQWGSLITMILSLSATIVCFWKSRAKQDLIPKKSLFGQNQNLQTL